MVWDPNRDRLEQEFEYFEKGIIYIKNLLDMRIKETEGNP